MTRLINYMNENITNGAFFISPKGKFIGLQQYSSHIDIITSNPKEFGLNIEDIRKTYEKYNERMGVEGRAREEIITNLIKQGWIHVRKRPNKYWNITVWRMTNKIRDLLTDWASKILKGIGGVKELNKFSPVHINTISGIYDKNITIDDVIKKSLYENKEEEIKYTVYIGE